MRIWNDHVEDLEPLAERLKDTEVLVLIRERILAGRFPGMEADAMKRVRTRTRVLTVAAAAAFGFVDFEPTARGGDRVPVQVQARDDVPRAQRLIDEVVKTYRALPTYVERGQISEVTRFRGKQRTKTSPVSLAFSRPNRLALRTGSTESVCDGKQLSIAWAPFRRYVEIKAPESIAYSTFTHRMDEVTRTVALSGDQIHFHWVMLLLSGSAQAAGFPPFRGDRWVVEPDRELDGKMLHSVLHKQPIDVDMSAAIRLLIDPDTKLVRKIQEFPLFTPQDLAWIDKEEPPLRWHIEMIVDRLKYPDRSRSGGPIYLSASSGLHSGRELHVCLPAPEVDVLSAVRGPPGQPGPRNHVQRRRQHGIEPKGLEIRPCRQGRRHRVLVDAQ